MQFVGIRGGAAARHAPELNPVEPQWSCLKGVELANLAGDTLDDITAAAERGIQRIRHTTGHPRRKSTDCSSILRRPTLLDGGSMATIPFIEHGPGVGRQPPDLLAPSPAVRRRADTAGRLPAAAPGQLPAG